MHKHAHNHECQVRLLQCGGRGAAAPFVVMLTAFSAFCSLLTLLLTQPPAPASPPTDRCRPPCQATYTLDRPEFHRYGRVPGETIEQKNAQFKQLGHVVKTMDRAGECGRGHSAANGAGQSWSRWG
jgi:hypothetical protein